MLHQTLPKNTQSQRFLRVGIYASIFLVVAGGIYGITHNFKRSSGNDLIKEGVFLKVGNENLYYADLSTELASYPNPDDESSKGILTQKLITDSIILQGGQEDGLIELDESFYNNESKDYSKRIAMIDLVKTALHNDAVTTKGYVVSVWFRNNGFIGTRGLLGSKEFARKKITALHTEVLSGRISIQKAGDIIKNDSSLKEVDIAYKNNAVFPFAILKGSTERVTLHPELDSELMNLPTGGVSAVYLGTAKDPHTDESYEAVYMFGQVTEKERASRNYISFEDWLESKKQIYEVGQQL